MDQDVAASKLQALRRCTQRVAERLPRTAEQLATDPDAQDIISVNLQRAVQLCVDLALMIIADRALLPPANMGEAFSRLAEPGWISADVERAMRSAVGFRNISVHEYRRLDWLLVHHLVTDHLDDFQRFAGQLIAAGVIPLEK